MVGHDYFGHGTHPYNISTDDTHITVFRTGFQIWTRCSYINNPMGRHAKLCRDLHTLLDHDLVIGCIHIRKARAITVVIRASKGVVGQEVDMILDNPKFPFLDAWL